MDIFNVFTMIGGLAMFLYGMSAMGNGLSKMAGGKLESVLEKLTSKKIYAVLLGAGVTAVIQSSSATTVMVVGFVNSGIMQLSQAVGIIMGANVGTTITSWMLSLTGIQGDSVWIKLLKPSSFSPVLAGIGIVLTMVSKGESKKKDIGNILLGFAILMFGMETMSSAVSPLKESEGFVGLLTMFSNNPLLGLLAGAVLTAIIQSSSASVGILQALCITGVVSYSTAIPIIMGQNIGTCVTAIISSIGATKNAKRASMIHLYFNLIGTTAFMIVFYALNAFMHFGFLSTPATAAGIATVHSLFNVGACIVLFPFANLLVKLSQITIRDAKADPNAPVKKMITIDERFLERPAFAMQVCMNKTIEMAEATKESMVLALDVLLNYDEAKAKRVFDLEDEVDDYEDALGTYLVKLSGQTLSKDDSRNMSLMLHSISDFERISDHAINIVEAKEKMLKKEVEFSNAASREVGVICNAVSDILNRAVNVFENQDIEGAKHVEPLEEVIDSLTKKIKRHHIKRLRKGKCTIDLGIILEDVLMNLERVSDHCSNIAVEILAINEDGYDTHEYYEELPEDEKNAFEEEYRELKSMYRLKKDDDSKDSDSEDEDGTDLSD